MKYETTILEDVLGRLIDYRGKTPTKTESGVRLITAKVIKDGRITDADFEFIADEDYDNWMRRGLPQYGDLLVTTEAPMGEVAELRMSNRIALAQRVILLRANPSKMDQRFMFHSFRSPFVQAELERRATGTTVKGIKQSELRRVRLPFPSLPTQRRIASILSAYDDLIENNTKRIKILEEMARGLYREWFVRFRFPGHEEAEFVDSPLGAIPKGWAAMPVDVVTLLVRRGVSPKYVDTAEQGELVLNQKCIRDQRVSLDPARRHASKVSGDRYLQVGDVLINSTGVGTLGRVAQVLAELPRTTVDSHVTIARPDPSVNVHYFGMMLLSMQSIWESMGAGATGQTELSQKRIAETQVLIASPEWRDQFGELVAPWRALSQVLQQQNQVLRRTRDLLLPRLISGALDVSTLPLPPTP